MANVCLSPLQRANTTACYQIVTREVKIASENRSKAEPRGKTRTEKTDREKRKKCKEKEEKKNNKKRPKRKHTLNEAI